jgi:hypothetical protein
MLTDVFEVEGRKHATYREAVRTVLGGCHHASWVQRGSRTGSRCSLLVQAHFKTKMWRRHACTLQANGTPTSWGPPSSLLSGWSPLATVWQPAPAWSECAHLSASRPMQHCSNIQNVPWAVLRCLGLAGASAGNHATLACPAAGSLRPARASTKALPMMPALTACGRSSAYLACCSSSWPSCPVSARP